MKYVPSQKVSMVFMVCIVGLLALAGLMAAAFTGSDADKLIQAVRAPYIAFSNKDSDALCADFTPTAADSLVSNGRDHRGCVLKVATVFQTAAPYEQERPSFTLKEIGVTDIKTYGDRAQATVRFGKGGNVSYQFALQRTHRRWLIASPAFLTLLGGCYIHERFTQRCSRGASVVLMTIGIPQLQTKGALSITPPPAVSRAGGRELREFELGSKITVGSGCLACHKIYEQGNSGPGPELTHVGSKLSERQIEHAILNSTAPMPSFKNLPRAKLAALVKFLSLLR